MNRAYKDTLRYTVAKAVKLYESMFEYPEPYQQAYAKTTNDFFSALQNHGFIKSYELGSQLKLEGDLTDVSRNHPTVRGDNPNINVMTAMTEVFKEFSAAHCERLKDCDFSDSWSMLSERQSMLDFLRVQSLELGMIKSYSVDPNNFKIELHGPEHYLTPQQLKRIADKQSSAPGPTL